MEIKEQYKQLVSKVDEQGALVRKLKAESQNPDILQPEVAKLRDLKTALQEIEAKMQTSDKFDRASLEDLLRKRFFYAPSFSIYGGVSGLYDYGPPGAALQTNIIDYWRKHFVLEEEMLEIDSSILTPYEVLKTSGHVDRFSDLMCKDLKTGDIYRVDHLVEGELEKRLDEDKMARKEYVRLPDDQRREYEFILAQIDGFNADQLSEIIKKYSVKSPLGNDLSQPEIFNLMFGTPIGPTGQLKGFLRPETAQGQFVNFKKLLEFNNDRMPFASALIGRSFRNEISPRSGLLRVREFTMAEIEHFVHPDQKNHKRFKEVENTVLNLLPNTIQMEGKSAPVPMSIKEAVEKGIVNNETLGYFLARVHLFLNKIGINPEKLRFRQHLKNEMAHYACDCWDAEIHTSYGWIECVGCADRSAYDLTRHTERTNEKLVARERLTEPKIVEKTVVEINKKLFGPAFKKDAKAVEDKLLALSETQLVELKKQLDENGGVAKLRVNDSLECEIKAEMLSISKVTEKVFVLEYTPNVIEPSFGIGRILYSLLEHVWWRRDGDENRHVLSFPPVVAPIKCLIVPISNNDEFSGVLTEIKNAMRKSGLSTRVDDSSSSIGKRYARNDELGTPFAITVDFETLKDGSVTLRERDSTKQIRAPSIKAAVDLVKGLIDAESSWAEAEKKFPVVETATTKV